MRIGLLAFVTSFAITAQAAPPPAGAPEKGQAFPGAAGNEVVWAASFEEAVATARKKPDGRILIQFMETGCGECMRLERLVVPSTSFYSFTRDKVPVQVDRGTEEGKKLADRLGVDVLPAWVIVTPDLLVSGLQIGTTNQGGWFETFVRSEQSWAAYKKKLADEKANPGDEALVFDIAQETFRRGGDEQAEPRFRRLVKDAQVRVIREQSLAYLASIALEAGRIDEAAKDLDTLLETAQDPILKERAELSRADVDLARGRKDLAAVRLATFKKLHPSSPLVKDADALLSVLRSQGFSGE